MEIDKKLQGKKSRAAGKRFEKRVRLDIEKKEEIVAVDKWTNNVEFENAEFHKEGFSCSDSKIVPAKPMFVFNPQIKRRIMISNSPGFPDFIMIGKMDEAGKSAVIGVESKMNGILDKLEKAKCRYYLSNNIFCKILIASKGTKKGQIAYKEFE